MAFCALQVGLALENRALHVVVARPLRQAWELIQWQQHPLPEMPAGRPMPPKVCRLLQRCCGTLRRRISLRVCFSGLTVFQKRISLPDKRLAEPALGWYLSGQSTRLFPEAGGPLTLDYRRDPLLPQTMLITAARKQDVSLWHQGLLDADLLPEVWETAGCSLRRMASLAGLKPDRWLLHRDGAGWLWASPADYPMESGFIEATQAPDVNAALHWMAENLPTALQANSKTYLSGRECGPLPVGISRWSPFSVFKQSCRPLPQMPGAFSLACGLALRQDDC
ncbi:hypothetical protein [Biostraticola tofi]|uniref:Pilus assembly protein HofM n=1 Tax=Biostraticola tofi TaxID=466109 RepID=A0A4R3YMY0_9GAMM|nr:hypothetical protein [Biostraticola tofi]TCV93661.1 pilus assembly protein HofM [Biostraticola tofi]